MKRRYSIEKISLVVFLIVWVLISIYFIYDDVAVHLTEVKLYPVIAKYFVWIMLMLVPEIFPVIIVLYAAFRYASSEQNKPVFEKLKKEVWLLILLVLLTFIYKNNVQNLAKLNSFNYRVNFAYASPKATLDFEKDLRVPNSYLSNVSEAFDKRKQFQDTIDGYKKEMIVELKTRYSKQMLDSLLREDLLESIEMQKSEILNDTTSWLQNEYHPDYINSIISSYEHEIQRYKGGKYGVDFKIWQLFLFPIFMMLLYIIGAQLGVLFSNNSLWIIGIMLFFVFIPIWYGLKSFFYSKIGNYELEIFDGLMFFMIVHLLFILVLYWWKRYKKI
ncbi:MAG: hypothetical protein OIF50_08355 [Flavobacteriaceae bacterium]|nr:hypothetical protein [Flavobacteriaceae bacterium]